MAHADRDDVFWTNFILGLILSTIIIILHLDIVHTVKKEVRDNNTIKTENIQLKKDLQEQMNINSMLLKHIQYISGDKEIDYGN